MPQDCDWRIMTSKELIERSRALTRAGRYQVAQSKVAIAEARRIMASVHPDWSIRAKPRQSGDSWP
jgi:hypothetical protein